MQNKIFQVDTFTDKIFGGNPACVVPLMRWLPDETLLKIAAENAVAETAFFVDNGFTFTCVGSLQILKWICVVMLL